MYAIKIGMHLFLLIEKCFDNIVHKIIRIKSYNFVIFVDQCENLCYNIAKFSYYMR